MGPAEGRKGMEKEEKRKKLIVGLKASKGPIGEPLFSNGGCKESTGEITKPTQTSLRILLENSRRLSKYYK